MNINMNVGRLLHGLHRGTCLAARNVNSILPPQGVQSKAGLLTRTLMTGRFQSLLQPKSLRPPTSTLSKGHLLAPAPSPLVQQPVRTKVNYSRTTGRPRTITSVIRRFFRLHNGQWVRARSGRNKKKWAKTPARLSRLQEHVMCNATQSRLLDRMVGVHFKRPRHYPNDPYAPYHKFENLPNFKVLKDKPKFMP